MNQKQMLCILASLSMVIFSCAMLKQLIREPEIAFEDVSLQDMSLFEATPVFKFKVTNPNPIGISIGKIEYNLTVNDKKFIKGFSDKGFSLKASGSDMVELPVTLNYLDVFSSVSDFAASEKVSYDLSGYMTIEPFHIPYHTQGTFDIPELPKISLAGMEITELSMGGASIMLTIGLENTNSFPIDMNSLNYSIMLGDKPVAQGKTTRPSSSLPQNGSSTITIPLSINLLELGHSVYGLLTGASSEYEINGEMNFNIPKIGLKSFPFQKSGVVAIER